MSPELAKQLHILWHALGVSAEKRETYRNHFCAGGKDEDTCRQLVAAGHMWEWKSPGKPSEVAPYPTFIVTDAGKEYALGQLPTPPKLTRSQRRWRAYRRVADIYPDWDFGDWLRAGYGKDIR